MKKLLLVLVILLVFEGYSQNKKYTTYRVLQNETISSIARKLSVTPFDLFKLNPDAKNGINIDEILIVPNKDFKSIVQKKEEIITPNVSVRVIDAIQKDSIVDGFIYHTVKKQETIYSLSKKFNTPKRKVRKLNNLDVGTIGIGQVLKFPTNLKNCCTKVAQNPVKEKSDDYFEYRVKEKDTYYSLKRLYNISEEELINFNPVLENGLQSDLVIKIPIKQEVTSSIDSLALNLPNYKIHIVQAKEGFFKLKQLYGVDEEELKNFNPELIDGLKLGMEIKIPLNGSNMLLEEHDIKGKLLNLVLMLPFETNLETSFSKETNKSKRLNKVVDYYLGSLIALDSLKNKGLSVNIKVFDTKNNDTVVEKFISIYDFTNTDIVIAAVLKNQFKLITEQLETYNIPIISPISNITILEAKNNIQNVPSSKILELKMTENLLSNYANQNIIIIADEKKTNNRFNINEIKSNLAKHDSIAIENITVIRMKEGYIKRKLFEENIQKKKENWVILASLNQSTLSNTVENLAVFSEEVTITLFSLMKPKNINSIDGGYKIKNKYLNRLNYQYPVANYINSENNNIHVFDEKYQLKYKANPTEFSYKGFDTTYDALIRIANYGSEAFKAGKSNRLITPFHYEKNINNSFTNCGMYTLKYTNFQLEKVE